MLAVYASRAPSTLCQRRLNFVVTKISDRSMPDSRMACPTLSSFR